MDSNHARLSFHNTVVILGTEGNLGWPDIRHNILSVRLSLAFFTYFKQRWRKHVQRHPHIHTSTAESILLGVFPVRLDAGELLVSDVSGLGVSVIAMLTHQVLMKPLCFPFLADRWPPARNRFLDKQSDLQSECLKQTMSQTMEGKEVVFLVS
jgi:hypothetical protein